MKKRVMLFITVLLFATGFVFAGGKQESVKEKAETPSTATEAERELRVTFSWPNYIDPAVGSDFSSSSSLVNLYDTLVYPTETGQAIPHVAEKWETSQNDTVWTFFLKEGVKFHDGSELTASDVVFSMNRLIEIGEGYGYLFSERVERTEAVDDYTVRFHMNKPYGPFLTTLARLYILNEDLVRENFKDEGAYGEKGDYGKEWLLTHDAGSGPYMVKEMRLEEYLLMEKFDDYWGEFQPNAPEEVKFIGTTEAITIRTMMSRQELEISDQWQSSEALKSLDQIDGVKIANMYLGTMLYLMMHTKKAPTDDIHFRKAMAWAMDYATTINRIFPGAKLARGPIAPGFPGHNPDVTQYKRDLEKAKAELAKSKYAGQLDQYPVEFHWIAEVPDEEKVALLFMSNMNELGIKVNVTKVPWLSVVEEMSDIDTSPNIVIVFVSPHYAEAGSLLESRYHSKSVESWEQNEWLQDETVDKLIEDALTTVDMEERFELYGKVQERIDELTPSITLFEQAQKHAYQESYVLWPAAEGKSIPVMGYDFAARFIEVFPEQK